MSADPVMLDQALTWAAKGWLIFPCFQKRPRVKGGFKSATSGAGIIRRWWTKWPKANIGFAVPSNLVVVDVDHNDGFGDLREKGLDLPKTFRVRTAKGCHFYYRVEKPVERKIGVIPHVDLCGTGGYVILPPSLHPSGVRYEAVLPIDENPIAEAPAWVYEIAKQRRPSTTQPRKSIPSDPITAAHALVPNNTEADSTERGKFRGALLAYAGRVVITFWDTKADLQTLIFQHLLARNLQGPRPLWRDNADLWKIAEDIIRMEREQQERYANVPTNKDGFKVPSSPEEQEFVAQFERNHPDLPTEKLLLRLAEDAEFFHDEQRRAFVTFCIFGKTAHDFHFETWPVESKDYTLYLRHRYYLATTSAPEQRVFERAVAQLVAKAVFEGPQEPTYLRVAEQDGAIYINLAAPDWGVVQIGQERVRGLHSVFSPIKFRRPSNMAPIPFSTPIDEENRPVADVDLRWIDGFLPLLGLDRPQAILFLAWITASMRLQGPKPGAAFRGPEGASKSTKGRTAQRLIDPSAGDLLGQPKSIDDLIVTAKHTWLLAFDNLSYLSDELSDALCRFSTGGGQTKRGLYTDDDLNIISFRRPWILTSITDVVTHGDLLSRTIFFDLPEIPADRRMKEEDYWREFDAIRPAVLWGLYRAIAIGLRNLPGVSLPTLPRMADFAAWAVACAPGLGYTQQEFIDAYKANILATKHLALANSPVAEALTSFMQTRMAEGLPSWEGTMTGLHLNLLHHISEAGQKSPAWPKTSAVLGKALRRLQQNLKAVGIEVEFPERTGDAREVVVTRRDA